jgi:hypothetical protein
MGTAQDNQTRTDDAEAMALMANARYNFVTQKQARGEALSQNEASFKALYEILAAAQKRQYLTMASPATVDYDAIAAQHGGKGEALAGKALPHAPAPGDPGAWAGLKRAGSNLLHMPGQVWEALKTPPQNAEEERYEGLGGRGNLALKRLMVDPMLAEHDKAVAAHAEARRLGEPQFGEGSGVGRFFDLSGSPGAKADQAGNMHDIASVVPLAGPMAAGLVERFQSGDKSGAATELLANIAGPKVMEGAGRLGIAGVNKAFPKVLPPVAERFYQSALKPPKTNTPAENLALVREAMDSGLHAGDPGALESLQKLLDDLHQKALDEIRASPQRGTTINKFKVARQLSDTAKEFSKQVNPEGDLKSIGDVGNEFLNDQPGEISAEDAQAIKYGTYKRFLTRASSEKLSKATIEAQLALTRGIGEELENAFPELKGLSAREVRLYDLNGLIEKSLNRQRPGLLTPLATGAVTMAGSDLLGRGPKASLLVGSAAAVLKSVLDEPALRSRLAIAIHKAGRGEIPLSIANQRVAAFSNALAQSQPGRREAPAAPVTVQTPDSHTYTFPDQASADAFKQKAGIK